MISIQKPLLNFLKSTRSFGRVLFLLGALALGWGLANVIDLIRGKGERLSWKNEQYLRELLGEPPTVRADVIGTGSTGKGFSTPFLAYYNGREFRLENDIMFGRPKSYWPTYEVAKILYEDGRISPDLYKIAAPIKAFHGRFKFQIQEIELEESFIKWLELKRVTHPVNTEIIVDSEYKKFHVVKRNAFESALILPRRVTRNGEDLTHVVNNRNLALATSVDAPHIRLERANIVEIEFDGLTQGEIPYLVVKSWFRDWMLGLEEEWQKRKSTPRQILRSVSTARAIIAAAFVGAAWLRHDVIGQGLGFIAPFIMGGGSCGSSGGTGSDCSCSFVYEYYQPDGQYRRAAISEPRAWHFNTELIEFPREAVLPDGRMRIRIHSSKSHVLGFIGAAQQNIGVLSSEEYKEEVLPLLFAKHSRNGEDITGILRSTQGEYVHTIPGDVVDLEFAAPDSLNGDDMKETYLMRASGFYTSLRPQSRELISGWQDRLSEEARSRLASLVPLRRYS